MRNSKTLEMIRKISEALEKIVTNLKILMNPQICPFSNFTRNFKISKSIREVLRLRNSKKNTTRNIFDFFIKFPKTIEIARNFLKNSEQF